MAKKKTGHPKEQYQVAKKDENKKADEKKNKTN